MMNTIYFEFLSEIFPYQSIINNQFEIFLISYFQMTTVSINDLSS